MARLPHTNHTPMIHNTIQDVCIILRSFKRYLWVDDEQRHAALFLDFLSVGKRRFVSTFLAFALAHGLNFRLKRINFSHFGSVSLGIGNKIPPKPKTLVWNFLSFKININIYFNTCKILHLIEILATPFGQLWKELF